MDKNFFDSFRTGDYQRENFENFLSHVAFKYDVPSIHVTGTNGKGSTTCYIASAYAANGYKTGLFKSPFLKEVNEMISINGKDISDEEFMAIYNQYKKDIEKYDLSAFEVQTFVALKYFSNEKCDIAVIECGMGGLIDATNIFDGILSIITTVSLEHTNALGFSISEIAEQKAGIIKEEKPVLIGDLPEDAIIVITKKSKETNSRLCLLGHYVNKEYSPNGFSFEYGEFGKIHIQSVADYSVDDCVMALEAITILKEQFPYDVNKIRDGIASLKMPCRLEIIRKSPLVIIDGAHNPEAMKALCSNHLYVVTENKPIHVIFACFRDKNLGNMLSSLGAVTDDLTITTFDNSRARTEEEYFLFMGDYPFEGDAKELIKRKMEEFPDDAFLITGSLAFAAYVKGLFEEGKL